MIPTFVLSIPVEYEAFKKYDENTFGFLKNYLSTYPKVDTFKT